MFEKLEAMAARPAPFSIGTAADLWADPHISKQMLDYHLSEDLDLASRNAEFVAKSADWIIDRFGLGKGKRVCDFGCGPGLYTTRFAEAGADVTGVDFSANSIDYANKIAAEKGLAIDYVLSNYLDFETDGKFDLMTLIFDDICPLSPNQRAVMFAKMRGLLADGGAILLDVLSLNHFESVAEKRSIEYVPDGGFWAAGPHFVLCHSFKYQDDFVTLDKYNIVEPDRVRDVYNWLQAFSPQTLAAEMEAQGLRVAEALGDVAGAPFDATKIEFAVVARAA
ncbi:MAG: class I SAM-dependent methyltransferase [Rhodospirillales bacterium]|nr:class I SAM-dependent methyltransferase [Rhodospirillales bacterium]